MLSKCQYWTRLLPKHITFFDMLEATPTGFFKEKRVAFNDSFRLEDNQTLFLVSNGRELTDEILE